MGYEFVDDPTSAAAAAGRYQFVDQPPTPAKVNAATDFGGDTLQVFNPATLWNPSARNFDTGIQIGQGTQNFLAGAGKATEDIGRGVQQLYAQAADKVAPQSPTLSSLVTGQAPSRSAAVQADIDESRRLDAPLMATGAGTAGNVAGNIVDTLPAAALGGGWVAAPVAGAALGAINPTATGESRLTNTLIGAGAGAAGKGATALLGRVAYPLTNTLSDAKQQLVRVLLDKGVPLDVAQRTGSPVFSTVKTVLGDAPVLSKGQANFANQQGQAFTKAVMGTIGSSADAADAEAMSSAKQALSDRFNAIAARNPVPFDDPLQSRLADIQSHASLLADRSEQGVINRNIDEILDKASAGNGVINGQSYSAISSNLGALTAHPSPAIKLAAADIKEALDEAMQRNAQPGDAELLAQTRAQWRNMRQIQPAVESMDADQQISVKRLANVLASKPNQNQTVYGTGSQELPELARAGRSVLPEEGPNSGTTKHSLASLATVAALEGVGSGVGAMLGGEGNRSEGAGLGAAAPLLLLGGGYGAGKLAQSLLNNQRIASYLGSASLTPAQRQVLAQALRYPTGAASAYFRNRLTPQSVPNATDNGQ